MKNKENKIAILIILGAIVIGLIIILAPETIFRNFRNSSKKETIVPLPYIDILENTEADFTLYTSPTFGFSMKIPRAIDFYSPMETPGTASVLVREDEKTGTIFIGPNVPEEKLKELNKLLPDGYPSSLLTIHVKKVASRQEADTFVAKLLENEAETVTKIDSIPYMKDMYEAEFADKKTGELSPIGRFFIEKYDPVAQKVAILMLGQDANFVKTIEAGKSVKQFDEDMYESFKFTNAK